MKILTFNSSNDVLFVSGMFAGGWMWMNTCPQIANAVHHVIDEPLCYIGGSVEDITDEIVREVKRIGRPLTLVGNSLGGLVCLHVARLVPDQIKQVVISGSAGFGEARIGITLDRYDPDNMAEQFANLILFDRSKVTSEVKSKTAESFNSNFRNIVRLMREGNRLKAEDVLSSVLCPVHAIWGRNDLITPYAETEGVCEQFNISLDFIDDCGHSPMYEKPDEFAKIVNGILLA